MNEISLIDIVCNESSSITEEIELKMQIKKLYEKMKEVIPLLDKPLAHKDVFMCG